MTRYEKVMSDMTVERLAGLLIRTVEDPVYDENLYGDMEFCCSLTEYCTSDGQDFDDFEEALEHEMWLLNQEV